MKRLFALVFVSLFAVQAVPEKAGRLLPIALTKTSDPKEAKQIFDEY